MQALTTSCIKMSTLLPACTLLLFASLVCVSSMRNTERAALIDSAIATVQESFNRPATVQNGNELSMAQKKYHAFKTSSEKDQKIGRARAQFEMMVELAEKKIIENDRLAMGQDTKLLAQSYAKELVHTPGTILTSQEIAQIYENAGCFNYSDNNVNCDDHESKSLIRNANGTCNNLKYPIYGAAGTEMRRLIPPDYENGISQPRGYYQMLNTTARLVGDQFAQPRPTPRKISLEIVKDETIDDPVHTLILMQWGQFMDHDLDAIPEYLTSNCSHVCNLTDQKLCLPFAITNADMAVTRLDTNQPCHEFRRSIPTCDSAADGIYSVNPREFFNQITHFIDGSTIYSHTEETLQALRGFKGRLILKDDSKVPGEKTLPQTSVSENGIVACPSPPCYLAGDVRINEQPGLITMHTMWAREHNRVANTIYRSECTSDQVFHLARHIVVSEIQKITYEDYLPKLLGTDLKLDQYKYNDYVIPNIPNGFAAAAYRFGHSQVQPTFLRLDKNNENITIGHLDLVDAFFDISKFQETGTDPILRGLLQQKARKVDEFINDVLTNKLFADDKDSTGFDLASLNIMRGRDHGLSPYFVWKNWATTTCGVSSDFMNKDKTVVAMTKVYGSLESVDLFIGGLAENPLPGGIVGATFACIFLQTFGPLRSGDRLFYENPDITTQDQMNDIKRSSLSRVICDNTKADFGKVPPDAFMWVEHNEKVPCTEIDGMELNNDVWDCRDVGDDVSSITNSNSDDELFSLLQSIIKQLGDRKAEGMISSDGEIDNTNSDSKNNILSDEELLEKLEELTKKK